MQALSHIQPQKYTLFYGNISQKNRLPPGRECATLRARGGGNETHSHLARSRYSTRTTLEKKQKRLTVFS